MKRIILSMLILMSIPSLMFAQKAVNERDVPERIVKDFQQREPGITNVKWTQLDSLTYEAAFVANETKTSIRFANVSTEMRWDVDLKWIPAYVKNYVDSVYKKGKIESVCIADIKGKKYYEAAIKQKKQQRLLTFGIDGVLVSDIEVKKKK